MDKINPILLALDTVGKIEEAAQQYVQAFNESGGFVIDAYKTRMPTEDEINFAKGSILLGQRVELEEGTWFLYDKHPESRVLTKKKLFVVEAQKFHRLPKDLEDLKLDKVKKLLTGATNK